MPDRPSVERLRLASEPSFSDRFSSVWAMLLVIGAIASAGAGGYAFLNGKADAKDAAEDHDRIVRVEQRMDDLAADVHGVREDIRDLEAHRPLAELSPAPTPEAHPTPAPSVSP